MFKPRKKIAAGLGAVVIAGTAGLAALAPAANAAAVTFVATCTPPPIAGIPAFDANTNVDLTVSPVKPTYSQGDVVTVTWEWKAYANNPSSVGVPLDSVLPTGKVVISGAQSGTIDMVGTRKNPPAAGGQPIILTNMTGTFTVANTGEINLSPSDYATGVLIAPGFEPTTPCVVKTPPAPVSTTLTVKAPADQPTLTATPPGKQPGQAVNLGGTKWTEPGPYQVELCDASGNACDAAGFSANTAAADAAGALTGTATLAATATPGAHQIKVSNSVQSAKVPYTVAGVPVRDITISPASGKAGTAVSVSGVNYTPNAQVAIAGVAGGGQSSDAPTIVTTDANGAFSGTFTVNDPATTAIVGAEVADQTKKALEAFLFINANEVTVTQNAQGTIKPGVLDLSQQAPGISLSEITLNGTVQTMNGALNQVKVVDFRGSTLGWDLTGQITDFTSSTGGTLTKDRFSWTPSCAVTDADSPSPVVTGAEGNFGSGRTLCSQAASSAGTVTGGQFTGDAPVKLTVPKYQLAGTYTSTLTLSLS